MAENLVEARREARRKRILENSENRLQKIFANQSNIKSVPSSASDKINEALSLGEGTESLPPIHYPSPSVPAAEFAANGSNSKQFGHPIASSANHNKRNDSESTEDFLANHLLSNFQELLQNSTFPAADVVASQETENKPVFCISQHYNRLCIVCLALIVRMALAFNLGYIFGEILLVPFLLTELSAMLLAEKSSTPGSGSGVLQLALLFGGIIPSHATIITKIFNETSSLIQNLCIYLFTLVLCHTFLDWPG